MGPSNAAQSLGVHAQDGPRMEKNGEGTLLGFPGVLLSQPWNHLVGACTSAAYWPANPARLSLHQIHGTWKESPDPKEEQSAEGQPG